MSCNASGHAPMGPPALGEPWRVLVRGQLWCGGTSVSAESEGQKEKQSVLCGAIVPPLSCLPFLLLRGSYSSPPIMQRPTVAPL